MKEAIFEVCAENLESAQAAEAGGADRIELCAELRAGGLTPTLGLMQKTIESLSIPVHVMIQSRQEHFGCSAGDYREMQRQIALAKDAGAAGVVLGILQPDRRVDVERCNALVELASPMNVTFHRAFDMAQNLSEALEDVIQTGANCLLTSGGEADVHTGAGAIGRLREQAEGRLDVMAGGGLRLSNLIEVVRTTGVRYLHGSMTRERGDGATANIPVAEKMKHLEGDIREAVRLFRGIRGGGAASAETAHRIN